MVLRTCALAVTPIVRRCALRMTLPAYPLPDGCPVALLGEFNAYRQVWLFPFHKTTHAIRKAHAFALALNFSHLCQFKPESGIAWSTIAVTFRTALPSTSWLLWIRRVARARCYTILFHQFLPFTGRPEVGGIFTFMLSASLNFTQSVFARPSLSGRIFKEWKALPASVFSDRYNEAVLKSRVNGHLFGKRAPPHRKLTLGHTGSPFVVVAVVSRAAADRACRLHPNKTSVCESLKTPYLHADPSPDSIQIQNYDGPIFLQAVQPNCCPLCNSLLTQQPVNPEPCDEIPEEYLRNTPGTNDRPFPNITPFGTGPSNAYIPTTSCRPGERFATFLVSASLPIIPSSSCSLLTRFHYLLAFTKAASFNFKAVCARFPRRFEANRPFLYLLTAHQIPLFIGVYQGSEYA
ncbi:hypothetical protein MSG28_011539 [Choristoneura fumiferana]|uniref:Uncharacterized protein n=1 Tax=Choristoneura fumiferana TaxID=7141 RepID=A0ACC0JNJ5_CHOFU|nr:hypothetical protein MSG28_011539 [Choristoneura fumiferana]